MAERLTIFDTTLRDGEQSPGISLDMAEKLEIAEQLARLGVDVIEAGFPITSPGDFEAVQEIARRVEGPTIAGLARTQIRILWEEFLWRVGDITLDGPGSRLGSNFINATKSLPIRFGPGPSLARLGQTAPGP